MARRRPIFPSTSELDVLYHVMNVVPTAPREVVGERFTPIVRGALPKKANEDRQCHHFLECRVKGAAQLGGDVDATRLFHGIAQPQQFFRTRLPN